MAITLLPPSLAPVPEDEPSLSDGSGNRIGGGNFDDAGDGPHENWEPLSERWAAPLGAYRAVTVFAMVWIVTLFTTLTRVLESRWVHSKDWVSIPLPTLLYVNSAVLLLSSATIELARSSLRAEANKPCVRWLFVTLLLGVTFIGGQIVAWRDFALRGFYLTSDPGSFFFYLITAAHGLHLLAGIIALAYVALLVSRLARKDKQHTAVAVISLYWHFMDGLWLYVFGLLFVTIEH
jgi:cytochrome c oxidase subunit III